MPMTEMAPQLSIIVPVLNEAAEVRARLDALAPLRARGSELIVVDGGSSDGTDEHAQGRADLVIRTPRGRARQMNAGAARSRGGILLFLHIDTALPDDADRLVCSACERGAAWGRFDVRIDGRHLLLPVVAQMMNRRSRLTGIATGDQAIFVRQALFDAVGRYPEIPLMEDIALCARLKRTAPPLCLRERVMTSGRRWETHGVPRTIWLMWRLRTAYFLGADPALLAVHYGYQPHD
jgi:rSAM/selenodomain-associated transferase 2